MKELVDVEKVAKDWIPLIRRFTGGGTVIVDDQTLFTTFIMNAKHAECDPYPRNIMHWSADIFRLVFDDAKNFGLSEHDYTLGNAKIGGNAQAIVKDRWCHHTSFLWSYDPRRMQYLLMPKKRPV